VNNGNVSGGSDWAKSRKLGFTGRTVLKVRRRKSDTAIIKPVTIRTITMTKKTVTHKILYLWQPLRELGIMNIQRLEENG
jgi:hypothetical protein